MIERLKWGAIPVTRKELAQEIYRESQKIKKTDFREIVIGAITSFSVKLIGKEQQEEKEYVLKACMSCYLFGYDCVLSFVADCFEDCNEEEQGRYGRLFTNSEKVEEAVAKQKERVSLTTVALCIAELSKKKYPIRIEGLEIMPGENRLLSLCASCYLRGMERGYTEVLDIIADYLKEQEAVRA